MSMLILDDTSRQFTYSGGQWTISTTEQWYGGTSYYPAFAGSQNATQFGSFNLTFDGISIAFIGNTPTTVSPLSQWATVAIDGGQPYNITYGDLDPQSYIQWYQSPTLADGSHTILVGQLAGTAIDLALIEVGSNTPLSGKTIFVDDNNPAINYIGNWKQNTNRFNPGTLPHGYPVGNTTHTSSTPGDTITFRFSGSSLSVYGIFSWGNLGVLAATYSLDGNTQDGTLRVTNSTRQYMKDYDDASNVVMFSDSTIQPGNHTLIINITQCINQTFMLDYITYQPAFSSLAAMPNLTITATSAVNAPTGTTQSTSDNDNDGGNGITNTGAIVGGVIGGLVFVAVLVFLLFSLRKRRRRERDLQNDSTLAQTQPTHVVPQMNQLEPPQGLIAIVRAGPSHALTPFQPGPPTHQSSGSAIDLKRSRANFERQPLEGTNNTIVSSINSGEALSLFQPGFPTHHGSGSAIEPERERPDSENQQRPNNIAASPLDTSLQADHSSRGDNQHRNSMSADLEARTLVESEPPSYDALSTNHPSPHRKTAQNDQS